MTKQTQMIAEQTEHFHNTGEQITTKYQTQQIDTNPLPSPEELSKYNDINPDIVTKLLEYGEREQTYRHNASREYIELDKKDQEYFHNRDNWLIKTITILIIAILIASIYFIVTDKIIIGGTGIFINIGLIIRTYFYIPKNIVFKKN